MEMKEKELSDYLKLENPLGHKNQFEREMVEIFHENSKQSPATCALVEREINSHLYVEEKIREDARNYKRYFYNDAQPLPESGDLTRPLTDLFQNRCSERNFVKEPLTDQQISDIFSGLQVTRRAIPHSNVNVDLDYRAYPSAGRLYPVETYVLRPEQGSEQWRCFHYQADDHSLTLVNDDLTVEEVSMCLRDNVGIVSKAGAIVVFTAMFERVLDKYGILGYRFPFIEAGGMAQHISLAATDIELSSVIWGGMLDDRLNKILNIDGFSETAILSMFVGKKDKTKNDLSRPTYAAKESPNA